jgi:adenylosuccinate synthase
VSERPGAVRVLPGVVVHIPSLLKELKDLRDAGVDYRGRIILSDRAHLVFDFHQTVNNSEMIRAPSIITQKAYPNSVSLVCAMCFRWMV